MLLLQLFYFRPTYVVFNLNIPYILYNLIMLQILALRNILYAQKQCINILDDENSNEILQYYNLQS